MNFLKYCISENYTIYEAIAIIEQSKERNVFVVNVQNKIIGVLSQGDVLKAILDGVGMHVKITKIYNKSFIYLKEKDIDKALKFVKNKNISLVPVINDYFELIDIITINDMINYLEEKI